MRFQVLSFSVLSSFLDTIVNEKRQCFKLFFEKFQPVYQFPYIMCYNVLCDFVSLIFSLIRVRNALWEDITQGKQ